MHAQLPPCIIFNRDYTRKWETKQTSEPHKCGAFAIIQDKVPLCLVRSKTSSSAALVEVIREECSVAHELWRRKAAAQELMYDVTPAKLNSNVTSESTPR
jgi:hypothetical protein